MYKWIVLKAILKFTLKLTLKQLQHVSVHSPSSGSALLVLSKVTVVKIANYTSVCGDVAAANSPYTDVFCVIGYFNNCNFRKHE
jgi:hypothetical protein